MKKVEVIILKNRKLVVPKAYLEHVYEAIKPSVVGMATVDPAGPSVMTTASTDNIGIDAVLSVIEKFKDSQMLIHLGEAPKNFDNEEECQPFTIFENEGLPMLVGCLTGDFSGFDANGEHSPAYQAFHEGIKPFFEEEFEKHETYTAFIEAIAADRKFKQLLAGVGLSVFLDAKDATFSFGTSPTDAEFPWGRVSNAFGYVEGAQQTADAPLVPGQKLNTLRNKFKGMMGGGSAPAAPASVPSVPATTTPAPAEKPVAPGFVAFADHKPDPKVKDAAMASAAEAAVTLSDLSQTHVKMAPPKNVNGANKIKKWYRKYAHDGVLPPYWSKKEEVWVEKSLAAELQSGLAKGDVKLKSLADLPKPAEAPAAKPSDVAPKNVQPAAPKPSADTGFPVVSAASKAHLKSWDDQIHSLKVLDATSRVILKPTEFKADTKLPDFLALTGYELHELLRIPHAMRMKLIKENPEAADNYLSTVLAELGSRMQSEELNPPVNLPEADKVEQPVHEAGAIPPLQEKKKRRFAL